MIHDCCEPVLFGWFKRESLYRIGLRHQGVFCAGQIEEIVKGAWFAQGRRLRTGETFE